MMSTMPQQDIPAHVWQAFQTVSTWQDQDTTRADETAQFRYRAHASVNHVEDGDTWSGSHKPDPEVVIDKADDVWYRLSKIDSHETDADDPEKRKQAQKEKQFVEEWIKAGRKSYDGEWPFVIEYESQDFEGAFGRLLVDLVRKSDGAELNDTLLAEFGDDIRYRG